MTMRQNNLLENRFLARQAAGFYKIYSAWPQAIQEIFFDSFVHAKKPEEIAAERNLEGSGIKACIEQMKIELARDLKVKEINRLSKQTVGSVRVNTSQGAGRF